MDRGELIQSLDDARVYQGASIEVDKVVVIKESQSGANEIFFDTIKSIAMTREEFAAAIQGGDYPSYGIRVIDGRQIPVSKKDGSQHNSLG